MYIHIAQTSSRNDYRQNCGAPIVTTGEKPIQPEYDIAAGYQYLRAFAWQGGGIQEQSLWWGFMPFYIDPYRTPRQPFAKIAAEKAPISTVFRHAWRTQRCIIPVDAFYLWRNRETKNIQRYCIRRQDGRPMCLAGLWDFTKAPKPRANAVDKEHRAFTLLTVPSNEQLAGLFDRMPLILSQAVCLPWVSPALAELVEVQRAMVPDNSPLDVFAVDNDAKGPALWVPKTVELVPQRYASPS